MRQNSRQVQQLGVFRLTKGKHSAPQEGVCAMEAVAWLAGEPHSDRPQCTCPIISGYVRFLNDHMEDDQRTRLIAYLPRLIGCRDETCEPARAAIAVRRTLDTFVIPYVDMLGLAHIARNLSRPVSEFAASDQASLKYVKCCIEDGYVPDDGIVAWHLLRVIPEAASMIGLFVSEKYDQIGIRAARMHVHLRAFNHAFETLDAMLDAGPQGTHDYDHTPAIERYRKDVLEAV